MLRWNKFRPKLKQLRVYDRRTLVLIFSIGSCQQMIAQTKLPLTDLSAFQQPAASWRIAGDVKADLQQQNFLQTTAGTGILVNLPEKNTHGKDLFSSLQHGDLDLELDYMMAKGSNSGIYLQGRYEIQLFDSWGTAAPRASDNGGIYERWNDNQPNGQQGYDGHPPRQNASRAPGLWQHMKIAFQAPRFDAAGNKIADAVILKLVLNGVTIHENVVLSGPTRGAMENNEVASGPLRIQGDHGTVAFRNIVINNYSLPKPELTGVKYSAYKGVFNAPPDFNTLKPIASGTSAQLSSNIAGLPDNEFLVRYNATLVVKAAGKYHFNLHSSGGGGLMNINNQSVIPKSGTDGNGSIELQPGNYPVEVLYVKTTGWAKAALTLTIKEAGLREVALSDTNVPADDPTDPILVTATENTVLRSFMDLRGGPRVTHAVSVGSPDKVHYTYDMDNGLPVQVWRGEFLNTTPMWHDRGDGSSRPMGTVQILDNQPALAIEMLATPETAWSKDTVGTGYRPGGYALDASGKPTFRYTVYGAKVSDSLSVLPENQGVHRTVTVQQPAEHLYLRIAVGDSIEQVSPGLYVIGDKSYYVKMDDATATPIIRNQNGRAELIVPVQAKTGYAVIF
ncbi:PA14 domain-containing protein [Chitinophaga niastensis]|uniref:PA14 domain-containing protein n=1 Tax=Chitinophaga niastensis TaxID=536980 RepID=A0A2P8HF75_CHINA|nr:family 16 glycoside hydrolase [Chitinophaga niastensis]PSL44845.1 PA14 domain-containing protein [Chitinophaga niastensis]